MFEHNNTMIIIILDNTTQKDKSVNKISSDNWVISLVDRGKTDLN